MSEKTARIPESVQVTKSELPNLRNSQTRLDIQSGVDANKLFIRKLFASDLDQKSVLFQKSSDNSFERVTDIEIDLDTFLEHLTTDSQITLQIGNPFPDRIRLGIVADNLLDDHITRYAILECPNTEANITAVQTLYTSVYG